MRNEIFDEVLDECYPAIKIGNIVFYASDILAKCDEVAYREALYEYFDGLHRDSALQCNGCEALIGVDQTFDVHDGYAYHEETECVEGELNA